LNGRHITAIVVAVCIAVVLAPISVLATTNSTRVVITDPNNPARAAHVSAAGALAVAGEVTSVPGLPARPFTDLVSSGSFTVPAGKHLVIETVSVLVTVTTGDQVFAELEYRSGGAAGLLLLPVTFSDTESPYDDYVATISVHVYADPGTTVRLNAFSTTSGGIVAGSLLNVSGYLV
jgi:hypothetical protein